MGDSHPPTTADYAYSAASDARQENRNLERRVELLERQVQVLARHIEALENLKS